jgi:hypothetical protein
MNNKSITKHVIWAIVCIIIVYILTRMIIVFVVEKEMAPVMQEQMQMHLPQSSSSMDESDGEIDYSQPMSRCGQN